MVVLEARENIRPKFDEIFLNIVKEIGRRATCDRGRSGALIVRDNRIISMGYVGAPAGLPHCDDVGHQIFIFYDEDKGINSKHCVRSIHAEMNAILYAAKEGIMIDGATMYCTMVPCSVCAKNITNAGISKVICEYDYQTSEDTKTIFKLAEIELVIINEGETNYE